MFLPDPDFSQNCTLRVLHHETRDRGALREAAPLCGFGAVGPGGRAPRLVGRPTKWPSAAFGSVWEDACGGCLRADGTGLCALVISVTAASVPLPMSSDAGRSLPSSFPITRGPVLCDPVWEWRVARGLHLRLRRCPVSCDE